MQKVFETYAQRKGVQASSLRFLLDGERIEATATPKMLELDDQDQIDCMLEQVRFCCCTSSFKWCYLFMFRCRYLNQCSENFDTHQDSLETECFV
jgi:small ubiquitin-related modifier